MYGTMVMNGVVEEKSNRIVEVMISSVKPFDLMMGKIIGIGLVGITQLLIWIVLIGGVLASAGTLFPQSGMEDAGSPLDVDRDCDMLPSILYRRIPYLCIYIFDYRSGSRQCSGHSAVCTACHTYFCIRIICRNIQHTKPRWTSGFLVFTHSSYITYRYDGTHTVRSSHMAGTVIYCNSVYLHCIGCKICGEDISCRNPYVWKETEYQRSDQMVLL